MVSAQEHNEKNRLRDRRTYQSTEEISFAASVGRWMKGNRAAPKSFKGTTIGSATRARRLLNAWNAYYENIVYQYQLQAGETMFLITAADLMKHENHLITQRNEKSQSWFVSVQQWGVGGKHKYLMTGYHWNQGQVRSEDYRKVLQLHDLSLTCDETFYYTFVRKWTLKLVPTILSKNSNGRNQESASKLFSWGVLVPLRFLNNQTTYSTSVFTFVW